ncbi:MAG: hypothetical protein IH611_06105 [Deltaproteobacteria bacterium]|nr:hypothetical protein [Deltaproteobacteria bacterium]
MKPRHLLVILLLCLGTGAQAGPVREGGMRNLFDTLDAAINNGEGYGSYNNASGTLAWAESYLLEAYLDMYEATKDNAYLDKFVRQAERVSGATDKARGTKDYRGVSLNGWSSTKYSRNGEPVVFIVHSGMILYPLVRFAEIVAGEPSLSRHGDAARRFVRLAEAAVSEFDNVWRSVPETGEGTYRFSGDEPLQADLSAPMALNGPLSLGRVIVALHRLTGKEAYLEKATGLAKYFKAGLRLNPDGAYFWGYRRDLDRFPKVEDISHGAIDVDFAFQAFQAGIVFTCEDMRRFSRTLVQARMGDLYSIHVNGTGGGGNQVVQSDTSGGWLELASCDCGVYESVFDYMSSRVKGDKKEHPQVLLGIAKLVKYHDRCRRSGGTP